MPELGPFAEGFGWLRLDLLGRLALATLLGGVVGFEREHSGKPAGLRTNILICVGATLLTELSFNVFPRFSPNEFIRSDPARLAAQIISGIGFLGAGTIIQARGSVQGLTTAATLWVVAAIGIAVGTGGYVEAVGATALVMVVLVILGWVEDRVIRTRVSRTFRLMLDEREGNVEEIQGLLEQEDLSVRLQEMVRRPDRGGLEAVYEVGGPEDTFTAVRARLLKRRDVRGFSLL